MADKQREDQREVTNPDEIQEAGKGEDAATKEESEPSVAGAAAKGAAAGAALGAVAGAAQHYISSRGGERDEEQGQNDGTDAPEEESEKNS
jgi:hypothetical protein